MVGLAEGLMSNRKRGRSVWLAALATGALGTLIGCETTSESPRRSVSAASTSRAAPSAVVRPVGDNLVGESCRLQPDARATANLPILRGFKIFCGKWQQESGFVYETAATPGTTGLMFDYANGGWWRDSLAARMDCKPPRQVAILDGTPAAMLDCSLHAGGWSYVALSTRIGNSVYLAEGIPAVLPPIEVAVAGLAGGFERMPDTVAQRGRSSAVQDLEARLAGRIYGTGDLQDYRNLLEVAQYYNANKEFAKAEERYREALALHEKLLGPNSPGQAYPMMHLALQLSNQERFDIADEMFKRAEALLAPGDARERARLLSYRAMHAANQQQHEQAYQLAQASTQARSDLVAQAPAVRQSGPRLFSDESFRRAASGSGREQPRGIELPSSRRGALADEAASRYIEAATQLELSRLPEAERNTDEALRLTREINRTQDWLYPSVLMLRANIQTARGDHAGAATSLREAIASQQRLTTNSRDEALAWVALGGAAMKGGRRDEGFRAYANGFRIVQERREGLEFEAVSPYLDAAYGEARSQPARASEIYREMFTASQLVTSSITAQSIARTAARFAAADPQRRQVIREWEEARQERDRLARRLDAVQSNPDAPRSVKEKIQSELAGAIETEREKDKQVQQAFPEYRQIADAPVSVGDLAGSLRPDEAVVSVVLGNPRSYIFFLSQGGIAVEQSGLSLDEAGRVVDVLRRPFEEEQTLPHYDVALAHDLYNRLLRPFAPQMQGVRHLITVPSGPLLSVPFGILVAEPHPPVKNYDYSRVKFVATTTAVSVSPAVASFVKLRTQAKPSNASSAFLGLGDALPISDPSRLLRGQNLPPSCVEDARLVAQLPRLPGLQEELAAVAGVFRGRGAAVQTREEFSEAAMRQLPLQNYRVIYLATHALLPRELNCFVEPALLTSLPRSASEGDNGLLEASEIRGLTLDADLVVLSGCNTGGKGTEKGGESLAGLARAFFGAGARSLLVSHWIIDNTATIGLMRSTFSGLSGAADSSLAEALRRSSLAMIQGREQSHPWYWGAFTVVGDGGRSGAILASAQ